MGTFILLTLMSAGVGIWNGSRYVKFDWEEFWVGFIAGFLGISFWYAVFDILSRIFSCNCSCP